MRVWPGSPHPLGATWDGEGVNFSIFSEHATAVELCIFEQHHHAEAAVRITMPQVTDRIWHCYLPEARPGFLYGYRVHGPWAPEEGHRFNPAKLVVDPYAKAITGKIRWSDELFGFEVGAGADQDLVIDQRDSAGGMPKGIVIDQAFTWGDDRPPRTAWNRTVIYETHVKGMTLRHPGVPEELRGTYLGLGSDAVLDHLVSLGVTAVELMPVHQFVDDRHLVERGLCNYWGYNTLGYFAPHVGYATASMGQQVTEFKSMVRRLHRAGLEVILDVVYNHTAEGNHLGPTLSLRGIDNCTYYRLSPENRRYYLDYTGTGNSLNIVHPRVMALIMDSLRYWVTDMHVDGFRFDLAPVLVRGLEEGSSSAFFEVIGQDPVLSQVKLIAEPWDVGPDGYQLGRFPRGWAEWNGAFRDCVRRFWRGDRGQVPELASRLAGSADIYAPSGRRTYASANFVTCHDGFTLSDLVGFERPHNEANPEFDGDIVHDGYSCNWGSEGATESVRVNRLRERMKRNFLATLLFSQGVPMLLGGDEIGRSQQGNSNAYCQDNVISWFDWDLDEAACELLDFTRELVKVLRANPVLRRRNFFIGEPLAGSPGAIKDVTWVRPDGAEMTEEDWADEHNRHLGMLVAGRASDEVDERGRPVAGQTLLLLLNASSTARSWVLPRLGVPGIWEELCNTARYPHTRTVKAAAVNLAPHSVILLRHNERL